MKRTMRTASAGNSRYPDSRRGGTWNVIDRLAKWAEPRQNQPRAPFRWVGYNVDKVKQEDIVASGGAPDED